LLSVTYTSRSLREQLYSESCRKHIDQTVSEKSIVLAIRDAYNRYGDKLLQVLDAALTVARSYRLTGLLRDGDFDYRGLVAELRRRGFEYNPSQLLRILEREYGILETVYHSSNQRWFKFKDISAVEEALAEIRGAHNFEDPKLKVIRIQIRSLQPRLWMERLKKMTLKDRLTRTDIKLFTEFSFKILPKIVKLLEVCEEYEEQLRAEVNVLKNIIELADLVSSRLESLDTLRRDATTQINENINVDYADTQSMI